MKESFDLIVVLPINADGSEDFISDTISSFAHYTRCKYKIILSDDSRRGIGFRLEKKFPNVDVVTYNRHFGGKCGLYVTLSLAFRHALDYYFFDGLLQLDTDGLIISKNPQEEALSLFRCYPSVGMAGQYLKEQDGSLGSFDDPRKKILNATSRWQSLRRPFAHSRLRMLYKEAVKNGYKPGDNIFGGAYFMSYNCLSVLMEAGLLPDYQLRTLDLDEDQLFSLLVKAIGFDLADLSGDDLPMSCAWKKLPASPKQLFDKGKKIIHSTRGWDNMKETEIRAFFRQLRVSDL